MTQATSSDYSLQIANLQTMEQNIKQYSTPIERPAPSDYYNQAQKQFQDADLNYNSIKSQVVAAGSNS
jgi:hypothetical protein